MTIDTPACPSAPDRVDLAARQVPLVAHLVRQVMARVPSSTDRNDLHAAGLLALLAAAREGEGATPESFADRAALRIRAALVDELRSVDWTERAACPRDPASARARLSAVLAQFPDAAAAAAALEMSAGRVQPSVQSRAGGVLRPERQDRRECLVLALEGLPEGLRHVARGYFLDQRPMAEVAAEIGVSEARAVQLRDEALALLRDALATVFGPGPGPGPGAGSAQSDGRQVGDQRVRRLTYTRAVAVQYAAWQSMTAAPRESTIA